MTQYYDNGTREGQQKIVNLMDRLAWEYRKCIFEFWIFKHFLKEQKNLQTPCARRGSEKNAQYLYEYRKVVLLLGILQENIGIDRRS